MGMTLSANLKERYFLELHWKDAGCPKDRWLPQITRTVVEEIKKDKDSIIRSQEAKKDKKFYEFWCKIVKIKGFAKTVVNVPDGAQATPIYVMV